MVRISHDGKVMSFTQGITDSVVSLYAATIYQGIRDRKHKLWKNIASHERLYTPYESDAGILLHMESSQWEN